MEFEENTQRNKPVRRHVTLKKHPSTQKAFARDVQSLVAVIEELGNSFEEKCLTCWF